MKSKKIVGLILAGAMALGVCSCDGYFAIKPDGPREIDETPSEEVTTETTVESTTEESTEASTEETSESTTENTTEATTKGTTETTLPDISSDDLQGTVFVSFQDKTAEEITENIIKICKIKSDTTLDNYPDCFTVYPNDTMFKDGEVNNCYYFWDPVALNGSEGIRQIMVHIDRNADGTLKNSSRVDILVTVEEHDRMELIYNAACEALKTICGVTSLSTTGTGDTESSLYLTYYVNKQAAEDGTYKLVMSFPLREGVVETAGEP